jgi:outer membrane lipoprotein-sorting protein
MDCCRAGETAAGAAAFALIAVMFAACAAAPIPPPPPLAAAPAAAAGDAARVAGYVHALEARDRGLSSMQTPAVMEYRGGGQHVKAREQIVVRKPAELRVEADSPFGVALVLAARGSELEIFDPSKKELLRAPATADALNRYVRIPMTPEDAVELLLALAPSEFPLDAAPDSVGNENGMLIASYGRGEHRQLGFGDDGALSMVRVLGEGGGVRYEVRYSDYHDIGGVMFPYVVDAQFPLAQTHLTLRYQRPIVNGDVPDSTFVLTAKAAG